MLDPTTEQQQRDEQHRADLLRSAALDVALRLAGGCGLQSTAGLLKSAHMIEQYLANGHCQNEDEQGQLEHQQ